MIPLKENEMKSVFSYKESIFVTEFATFSF